MLPDRVSNPGPLTYESGALPIALRGPAGGRANSVETDQTTPIESGLALFVRIFTVSTIKHLYSRTSVARTLMARLTWIFRTSS